MDTELRRKANQIIDMIAEQSGRDTIDLFQNIVEIKHIDGSHFEYHWAFAFTWTTDHDVQVLAVCSEHNGVGIFFPSDLDDYRQEGEDIRDVNHLIPYCDEESP